MTQAVHTYAEMKDVDENEQLETGEKLFRLFGNRQKHILDFHSVKTRTPLFNIL